VAGSGMKYKLVMFLLLAITNLCGQEITNFVLVGPNGVTDDEKKAESFVVVKRYPDRYERLDYKMFAPLVKSRSYKDSTLKVLHGEYYEYRPDGRLLYNGTYRENLKNGYWNTYDEKGKVVRSEKFENDSLVEVVDLNKKDSAKSYDDERESEFPGGQKGWIRYLTKSIEKSEAAKRTNGGQVIVVFVVNGDGKVEDAYLIKSANFSLDENSLEIINKSPKWKGGWQNGRAVKTYKQQPITYGAAQ
jgi:TonB family protein